MTRDPSRFLFHSSLFTVEAQTLFFLVVVKVAILVAPAFDRESILSSLGKNIFRDRSHLACSLLGVEKYTASSFGIIREQVFLL